MGGRGSTPRAAGWDTGPGTPDDHLIAGWDFVSDAGLRHVMESGWIKAPELTVESPCSRGGTLSGSGMILVKAWFEWVERRQQLRAYYTYSIRVS